MSDLIKTAQLFIEQQRDTVDKFSDAEVNETRDQLIELITFGSSHELLAMLSAVRYELFGAFPLWASALAYRLLCLMNPDDRPLREAATSFLRCFAPEYEELADRIERGEIK